MEMGFASDAEAVLACLDELDAVWDKLASLSIAGPGGVSDGLCRSGNGKDLKTWRLVRN